MLIPFVRALTNGTLPPALNSRLYNLHSLESPKATVTERPLIVLSLEGLATAALGCYGSSWNQTPAIDTIAGSGCVWDRWIAVSDDPNFVLKQTMESAPEDWAKGWRERGSIELLSDSPALVDGLNCPSFDRVDAYEIERPTAADVPVTEIADSQLGQLIAAAVERDSQAQPWSLLWLHSQFLTQRWDAPRDLFPIDEDDAQTDEPSEEVELISLDGESTGELERLPPIFDAVIPPQFELDDQTHPDLVTSWMRTYGCQIGLLDLLIQLLLQSLGDKDPYLMLVGTSGFRLGQCGSFGNRPGSLRSADIRIPMMISDCGPLRIPQVTGSNALPGILSELAKSEGPLIAHDRWSEASNDLQVETQSSRSDYAVTTSRWFYVRDDDASEHLFLKPDDVEDFNDIGRLRQDVVQQLSDKKE